MKNFSFYVIVDIFFKFVLLFLFNLIWCTYFINKPAISISLSIVLSIIIIFIANKISSKKQNKKLISIKEQQKIENIALTFTFMNHQDILSFFYNLASSRHKCTLHSNYIEIETSLKPILLFPLFKSETFNSDDVLNIYKQISGKEIKRVVILTNNISPNISSITKHIPIELLILNKTETYYNLLKEYEFYPEIKIKNNTKKVKTTFRQLLLISLNKNKTKSYFISSIILFFSSFFVRYKIYYLIFSSLLIFLALFSWFNPNFNKIDKKQTLD